MTLKAITLLAVVFALHALWVAVERRRPTGALLRMKRHALRLAVQAGCPFRAVRWMPL